MKYEEMKPLEGKYVFLVVAGGRSFPCHVLRVAGEVLAVETDHDDWPLSLRRAPLDNVVYAIGAEDVDTALEETGDRLSGELMPDGLEGLRAGPAEFFGKLRAELNGEDLLARPLKPKNNKKKGKAA